MMELVSLCRRVTKEPLYPSLRHMRKVPPASQGRNPHQKLSRASNLDLGFLPSGTVQKEVTIIETTQSTLLYYSKPTRHMSSKKVLNSSSLHRPSV